MLKFKKKIKDDSILNKRTGGEKVVFGIVFGIFAIYALSLIFPVIWLVIKSLEDSVKYTLNIGKNPFAFPETLVFENYVKAFTTLSYTRNGKTTDFFGMFFNSLWTGLGASAVSVFFHACTGYVFAKYNFKAKPVMYFLVIFSLTVPVVGTTAATYKIKLAMGLYDNPLSIFVTNAAGFGGNFLVMLAIFKSVSWTYAEAVFIDGGNDFTVFFRIMLPQALPAMLTLFIQAVITHWKEYTNILMFLPSYPTLATGLYMIEPLLGYEGKTPYFAGLILSTLPIVILYMVCSDQMMKNLSVGGIKG